MAEESISQDFILKMTENELISKKYKNICKNLNNSFIHSHLLDARLHLRFY